MHKHYPLGNDGLVAKRGSLFLPHGIGRSALANDSWQNYFPRTLFAFSPHIICVKVLILKLPLELCVWFFFNRC